LLFTMHTIRKLLVLADLSNEQVSREFLQAQRDFEAAKDHRDMLVGEILRRCEERKSTKLPGAPFPLGRKPKTPYKFDADAVRRIREAGDMDGVPDELLDKAARIEEVAVTDVTQLRKIAKEYGLNTPVGETITGEIDAAAGITTYSIDYELPKLAPAQLQETA
jgi:hypothetical protein